MNKQSLEIDSDDAEIMKYRKEASFRSKAFIVFSLIGLALSTLVYFAGRTVIQERTALMLQSLTARTIQTHLQRIDEFARQLDDVAEKVSDLPISDFNQLKQSKAASRILDSVRPFNFIAYHEIDKGNDQLFLLDRKVLNPDLMTLQAMATNKTSLTRFLLSPRFQQPDVQVLTNTNLINHLNYLGGTSDAHKKIVFIKKLPAQALGSSQQSWLIAEEKLEDIFTNSWQNSFKNLDKIIIRDIDTDQVIYRYENSDDMDDTLNEAALFYPEQLQTVSFGGQKWSVITRLRKEDMARLLGKVPYISLAIGLFFTVLASLMTILQVRQENKIRRINYRLEEKNKALETEMERREKLNSDLKQSEAENLALVNSLGDIIFETDRKGNLSFVNKAWSDITGFDLVYSKGKNLFNLLHPDDQLKELDEFDKLLKGEKTAYRNVTQLRTIDGSFRAVDLSFSMVRRAEDGAIRVVGSITDIEERRRAEEALGEVEKKFREIVDHAAWAVYQMTPEGALISTNPAMHKILGYEGEDDFYSNVTNAFEHIYPNRQERKAFLRDVDSSGTSKNGFENRALTKQGQQIWIRENIRAVKDEQGKTLYYEGSFEDITARKESDALLRQAKMNSDMANRAKSEFITNMSHELRTPLNSIIGFSEIISSESFGPLGNESYKEYSQEIYNSGRRLLKIINEILDVAKIDVQERELNESSVKIPKLMQACVELLQGQADMNKVKIINNISDMPDVIAEERAVKQIFTNVLSNAIKFTPQDGDVTISNEMAEDGGVNILFADTGIGLDGDDIKKALSPFGQVGSSLNQKNAGTGLGLTLVKALVELHQGTLDIVSQKGMGTTVIIKLPKARVGA